VGLLDLAGLLAQAGLEERLADLADLGRDFGLFQFNTSPCSVMRISPLKLSSGCAKMARCVGPPPRPTVPPRPWNRRSVTPHSRATSCRARCAFQISQVLAIMPPSLFESE
jgi:hypothetical protein